MIISSARLRSYIHIPDIARKTQIKYLGIYSDQTLHWGLRIQHINNKLAKKLNYSQIKIFCRSSYTETVMLFFHLSIPILYATMTWGSACKTSLHLILTKQNKCMQSHTIMQSFRNSKIVTNLKWLSLHIKF